MFRVVRFMLLALLAGLSCALTFIGAGIVIQDSEVWQGWTVLIFGWVSLATTRLILDALLFPGNGR